MVPKLGVNLDFANTGGTIARGSGRPAPTDLAPFSWVRLVPREDDAFGAYVVALREAGRRVLLVFDADAMTQDPAQWPARAAHWASAAFMHAVDGWQIGNEADGVPHTASWAMSAGMYATLLSAFEPHVTAIRLARPGFKVISAGLSSGNPGYLADDALAGFLDMLDGIAVHPYGQQPSPPAFPQVFPPEPANRPGWCPFGTVDNLMNSYARVLLPGQRLWISEFGTNTKSQPPTEYHLRMFRCLAARPDVEAAMIYCWSDVMNQGFGLVNGNGVDNAGFQALLAGTT